MTSTPDDQRSADSSISAFSSAIIFNVITTSASFAAFAILRPRQQRFYAPKTFFSDEAYRAESLPPGLISWLKPLFQLSDEELRRQCGLDHYLFLRFIRMCLYLFLTFGFLSLVIICPLSALDQRSLPGLNLLTYGNILDTGRLWGHLVLTVLYSVIVLYVLYREALAFLDLRMEYLQEHAKNIHARTILVRDVPKRMRSEKLLHDWYNMYPGGVEKVSLTRNPSNLPRMIKFRNKILKRLEKSECKYLYYIDKERVPLKQIIKQMSFKKSQVPENTISQDPSKQDSEKSLSPTLSPVSTLYDELTKKPTLVSHETVRIESEVLPSDEVHAPTLTKNDKRPTMMSIGSWNPLNRVDALSTLRELYQELNHDIEAIQQSILSKAPTGSSAFITFNTQAGAQVAAQTLTTNTPMKLQERMSNVATNDVMWKALDINYKERMIRSLAGNAISIALNIFWCIIVAFITSIATLSNLERLLPFLSPIINLNETIHGIIEGLIPSVAISTLMSLLPVILSYLAMFEGIPLISEIERYVQSKYFMFLIINVLLVVTIAGTVFSSVAEIIHSPTSIINLLATSLPSVSTFFVNYLILQAFLGAAIELVRISNLAVRIITLRYFNRTPRAIFMRCHPRALRYGTAFPQLSLVFSIGMVFATIAPMVITFAVLYYAIFYFVYLHQIHQYYAVNHQTAGLFYWKAMHHVFIGLIIQQLTVAGLFLLRSATVSGFICLFILLTTLFLKWHVQKAYDPLVYNLPMTKVGVNVKLAATRCEFLDAHDTEAAMGKVNRSETTVLHSYLHPSLITPTPKVWLPETRSAHTEAAELRAMGIDAVVDRHVEEHEAVRGTKVKHQNTDASIGFPETFGAGSGFLVNLMSGH
ncbi:hypothetical protein BGW37DRAFT_518579 [Umbelopsis sp. PMI_123]|nr:hypothetical protein BGW37DRAFT_518579 [Umbelopsis sp. PMI_123]